MPLARRVITRLVDVPRLAVPLKLQLHQIREQCARVHQRLAETVAAGVGWAPPTPAFRDPESALRLSRRARHPGPPAGMERPEERMLAPESPVDDGGPATNLLAWVRIDVASPAAAQAIAAALAEIDLVEGTYIEAARAPEPGGDDVSGEQHFLSMAPFGVGALSLHTHPERGAGCGYADVESGWILNDAQTGLRHQDLPQDPLAILGPVVATSAHGTHILGIVSAREQVPPEYCVGVAPGAVIRALSSNVDRGDITVADPGGDLDFLPDHASAIADAAARLDDGDVLLIEAQVSGQEGSSLPVEALPREFEVIALAVQANIVVVAAAGNGMINLDEAAVPQRGGKKIFAPGDDLLDSGSILVAAAEHGVAPGWRRVATSNHGSRVGSFADGVAVRTLGDGSDGVAYTNSTSAAAAIVAGAVLTVQGLARSRTAAPTPLSPAEVRAILERHSTVGEAGIGRMPDLVGVERELLGLCDVWLADSAGDTAVRPLAQRSYLAPSIVVRQTPIDDSALPGVVVDDGGVPEVIEAEATAWVYVRVQVPVGSSASELEVALYTGPRRAMALHGSWVARGSYLASVDTMAPGVLIGPFILYGPEATQCSLMATVSAATDPAPRADWLGCFDYGRDQVLRHNNIAWRNQQLVRGSAGAADRWVYTLTVELRSARDGARAFEVGCDLDLPVGSTVTAQLPAALGTNVTFTATRSFGAWSPGQNVGYTVTLVVDVPVAMTGTRRVAVWQRHDGLEVGRHTWELSPPVPPVQAAPPGGGAGPVTAARSSGRPT